MQSKCAVFRTDKTLKEGADEIRKTYDGMSSISVKDKSLIFNTDLVETLEFDNLIRQAITTVDSAYYRKESRGALQEKIFQKEMMKNLCNTLFLGVMEKIQRLNIDLFIKKL